MKAIEKPVMTTREQNEIDLVLVILVDGMKYRALLDTEAERSSYILFELAGRLEEEPLKTDHKQINTMLHTTPPHVVIYKVQMTNVEGNFTINAQVSKVNKPNLISLTNPRYKDVIQKYSQLKEIQMKDNDEMTELPTHVTIDTC